MPLDLIARRYAETLFTQEMERLAREHQKKRVAVASDFAARNMLRSGMYFTGIAQAGIEYLKAVAQARADTLLHAYDSAGLRIDDQAVSEIYGEVAKLSEAQGRNLKASIQTAAQQQSMPEGVASSVGATIEREASGISNGIRLQLFARRDKDILAARTASKETLKHSVEAGNIVFLSHAAYDEKIARFLKTQIETAIRCDVFVSSDPEDLQPGDPWVETILQALRSARLVLVIASERGISRKWVWYEAGAGWSRDLRVIPCCVGRLRKGQLPAPFSRYQALDVDAEADFRSLLDQIARELGLQAQPSDSSAATAEIKRLNAECELAGTEGPSFAVVTPRLEAVRLSAKMINISQKNITIEVENESAELVRIVEIRLEDQRGFRLTEPAHPQAETTWTIDPGAKLSINWVAGTAPAATMVRLDPNRGTPFDAEVHIVFDCDVSGGRTTKTHILWAKIDATSLRIVQLAG